LGEYKYVAVRNGQEKAASATSAYIPLRVRQVEGFQIFDISPPPEDKKARWKVSEKKLEGERISIVSRRRRWQHSEFSIKEYGFNQGGLLIDYRDNDLVESFSNFHSFGVVQFPDSMTVALHRSPVLTAHISVLEKLPDPVAKSLFNPKSIPNLGVDPSIFVDIGNDPKHRPKGVTPPKLTHYIDAEYPRSERRSRTEGSLLIKCTVDAKGAVREPYILRSDGAAFDDAAIRAVRQYKFKPATKDGQAGMSTIVVLVAFHIYN
jgi:TonB family protein